MLGSGPLETTMVTTVEAGSDFVPAPGVCEITWPAGTVSLNAVVTVYW